MNITFLGVRGSIPVSGSPFQQTGGNTTCVQITYQGARLLLDGGTGLAALGQHLGCTAIDATLLFTHVHWDHIQGVPFFAPLFHPGSRITLMGQGIEPALRAQMQAPQFPIGMDAFGAELAFKDVCPPPVRTGPFTIHAMEMSHPNGVLVYRIEAGERAVVFATDIEHGNHLDERLLAFSEGADLLIHDAQYHDAEYRGLDGPPRTGWGHSTWEQAVEVGRRAGVARTALFHHDPCRDDRAVRSIEQAAQERLPNAFAARQGVEIDLRDAV